MPVMLVMYETMTWLDMERLRTTQIPNEIPTFK
jgi:hypothetical protein